MSAWLKRNTMPVVIVFVAAAVVIGAWELVDSLLASEPFAAETGDETLTLAGLIKVAMFLLVPGLITLAVRRRQPSARVRH